MLLTDHVGIPVVDGGGDGHALQVRPAVVPVGAAEGQALGRVPRAHGLQGHAVRVLGKERSRGLHHALFGKLDTFNTDFVPAVYANPGGVRGSQFS